MLKAIARFILREELAQMYSDARLQQLFLDQWKLSSQAWEKYAKKFVRPDAPAFRDWFFRDLPKQPPPHRSTLS